LGAAGEYSPNAYIKVGNTYRFSIPMVVEALTVNEKEADTTRPNEATAEVAQEESDDFGFGDLDDDL
jgi:hypothetical protein